MDKPLWRMSPYEDHRSHAFRELKAGTSVTLCELSMPTSQLGPDDEPKCVVCVMVHGRETAESNPSEQDRWAE